MILSYKKLSLILSLGFLANPGTTRADGEDFIRAIGIGAVAAGGGIYGLYKFFSWLTTPSNQDLLNSANTLLAKSKRYQIVKYLPNIMALQQTAFNTQLNQTNETLLFYITQEYFTVESISHFNREFSNFTYEMKNLISTINDRVNQLDKSLEAADSRMRDQLALMAFDLSTDYARLSTVEDYLVKEQAYIELWQNMNSLYPKFEKENQCLAQQALLASIDYNALHSSIKHNVKQNIALKTVIIAPEL